MIDPGDIVVITGIMAAGKSTIAQALAERIPRSVHLRGDIFRRCIVNGQAVISAATWDDAVHQLHLRYRLAAAAALTYSESEFAVMYQDVILGKDVAYVRELLLPAPARVFLIVLAPNPSVAAARDRARHKVGYVDWSPEELDRGLREETPHIGLWLDTSHLTVDETVDAILANLEIARIDSPSR